MHVAFGISSMALPLTHFLGTLDACSVLINQVVPPSSQDNLVIHIGHVHHKQAVITKVVLHDSPDNVERKIVPCMTDMGDVVNGRT